MPRTLTKLFGRYSRPTPKRWDDIDSKRPWFDRPDALRRLDALAAERHLTEAERDLLRTWVEDGYFVVDDCIDYPTISKFSERIDDVWFRSEPLTGLQISDVKIGDITHVHYPHEDLIKLPREVRERAKRESNWRIGEYHQYEDSALAIFRSERLVRLCSMIFDKPAVPHFSLTFSKGSLQGLHQDTCVFHVYPRDYITGVWIACEDISPDSGPLEIYPGSHTEPLFAEFTNYPQTQRRTAPPDQSSRYDAYVAELAKRYERRIFTPKLGAALFWHGMLIHGGAPVNDPASTRKSFVIHFMPAGANRGADVVGPFNW